MGVLRFLALAIALMASPATAKGAAAWIVAQKSGEVRVVRNGLQPASLQVQSRLSPGDLVATGVTGRAMLTNGDDYVIVAPSSRLVVPKEQDSSGFTRLVQQVGTMLYKVKHTGIPHFSVNTPMLAAVVKGTSFTIVVDENRAAVQVTDGVVEVSSATGNARRLVERGMTVYVGRVRPDAIIEMKPGAAPLPTSGGSDEGVSIQGSGDVSLGTIANLTDGLVREAPTVAVSPASATTGSITSTPTTAPVVSAAGVTETAVQPVTGLVQTVAPEVTQPVVDIVQATAPSVTEPLVGVVQTAVPLVTQPIVEVVQTTVPTMTQPVLQVVEAVTQPVTTIVQPVVQTVTQPIVQVVDTVVPTVTEPVTTIVQPVVQTVTQPVLGVVGGLLGGR